MKRFVVGMAIGVASLSSWAADIGGLSTGEKMDKSIEKRVKSINPALVRDIKGSPGQTSFSYRDGSVTVQGAVVPVEHFRNVDAYGPVTYDYVSVSYLPDTKQIWSVAREQRYFNVKDRPTVAALVEALGKKYGKFDAKNITREVTWTSPGSAKTCVSDWNGYSVGQLPSNFDGGCASVVFARASVKDGLVEDFRVVVSDLSIAKAYGDRLLAQQDKELNDQKKKGLSPRL